MHYYRRAVQNCACVLFKYFARELTQLQKERPYKLNFAPQRLKERQSLLMLFFVVLRSHNSRRKRFALRLCLRMFFLRIGDYCIFSNLRKFLFYECNRTRCAEKNNIPKKHLIQICFFYCCALVSFFIIQGVAVRGL